MDASCREIGLVEGFTPEGKIQVVIKRAEACHSCAAKGACRTLGGNTRDLRITVENSLQAEPGDQVVLSLSEVSVIAASAVVYLLPALGLVGGAVSGWALSSLWKVDSDPTSILGALLGLAFGMAATHLLARRMGKNPRYVPKLTAIQKRGGNAYTS